MSTSGEMRAKYWRPRPRPWRSPQYKKILAAFDMSDSQTDMRFNTVVETMGMQLIAKARGVETFD